MGKVLGMDLGANSIGWAIVDNGVLQECGVKIVNKQENSRKTARQNRRASQRLSQKELIIFCGNTVKANPILTALTACVVSTFLLSIINSLNWQFWLNLSITALVSMLTLMNSKNNNRSA